MYYEKVFQTLNQFKVDYLIAGGMAVNLYGVPRFTKDLDILIEQSDENLRRLAKALTCAGFRPKISVTMDDFLNKQNWKKWKRDT